MKIKMRKSINRLEKKIMFYKKTKNAQGNII